MKDISERIAKLSPEKRKLLEQLLAREARSLSGVQSPLQDAELPATSPDQNKTAEASQPIPILTRNLASDSVVSSPLKLKTEIQKFYDTISQQLDATIFADHSMFLNYGYVSDGSAEHAAFELAAHTLNRASVKLVLEVIGRYDLNGASILDVGCGRGGTVDTIVHYYQPREVIGVDLSPAAIAFCQRRYKHKHVRFQTGDAEALSFADRSFDYVTNIESSHSYSDIAAFYQGVYRMLKSNGVFLYTDNMPVERMQACISLLQQIGFELEVDRDITRNVLLSCDEQSSRKVQTFSPDNPSEVINGFLAVPGSQIYETMKDGQSAYRILSLRKAGSSEMTAEDQIGSSSGA